MNRSPRFLAVLALCIAGARAETLTGTFDFTGATIYGTFSTAEAAGTASFTYDTVTNLGRVYSFYWLGGTLEDFDFAVFPTLYNGITPISTQSNPGDWAHVTDFADLVNFGPRTRTSTGLGGGNIENYYRRWVLLDSDIKRGEHLRGENWSYSNNAIFNPPVAYGTATNFAPTPEPSTTALLVGAASIFGAVRRRGWPVRP